MYLTLKSQAHGQLHINLVQLGDFTRTRRAPARILTVTHHESSNEQGGTIHNKGRPGMVMTFGPRGLKFYCRQSRGTNYRGQSRRTDHPTVDIPGELIVIPRRVHGD